MEKMNQETFDALVRYHLSVCEREDLWVLRHTVWMYFGNCQRSVYERNQL